MRAVCAASAYLSDEQVQSPREHAERERVARVRVRQSIDELGRRVFERRTHKGGRVAAADGNVRVAGDRFAARNHGGAEIFESDHKPGAWSGAVENQT